MKDNTIISDKIRPLWQRLIAAAFFTTAIAFIVFTLYKRYSLDGNPINIKHTTEIFIYLISIGITFSFHKSVYINLKKSKFRSTFEIGPIKLGQWKTISNYEYVSIFHQPLKDGNKVFEVNLWYDNNKHWELYKKHDFKEAFLIGFEISNLLDIDILDATIPNDYKWINKDASKKEGKMIYTT